MTRRLILMSIALILLPTLGGAVPQPPLPRLRQSDFPDAPSYVRRIEPAIVAVRVRAAPNAPSSARLGVQRFATGVIFDARGYVVTVSYALMDAVRVEAQTRAGKTITAKLAGIDLESGLGIVKLDGAGPWPAATLGISPDVNVGALTGTVGVDEDNELVWVTGSVHAIRRFSGFWEYMLDRAFLVAPGSPSWGGSAVVDASGAAIAIASLRIGDPPHINVAIPMEKFVSAKDELIAAGRVVSRRPRPWLGLYTIPVADGVVVEGFSPVGPARHAGFVRGDRIVSVNDVPVGSQEEFYEELWRGRAGDVVRVAILRDQRLHIMSVRSVDRYQLIGTSSQ